MEKITAIRGFKDILPDDALAFCRIESLARTIFDSFGFREIRVPILEKTELFQRSIGETTDIVEKEMYTFTDRDNDQITLRPEATASVIRAYIEHNMSANESVTSYLPSVRCSAAKGRKKVDSASLIKSMWKFSAMTNPKPTRK